MAQNQTITKTFRERWTAYINDLQNHICTAIEEMDGKAKFMEDEWQRSPDRKGGGGKTRVIANGNIFEKGGVNTSAVYGEVTPQMRNTLKLSPSGDKGTWFACGLSLVLHPENPFIPTVHANFRYFELYDYTGQISDQWFGGGADLTPYYLFEEDARHFHQTFKEACDPFGEELYPEFKQWCDEYFVNKHRQNERRGIGGIFYDHLRPGNRYSAEDLMAFSKANGDAFLKAYLPIVHKRKTKNYRDAQKKWQEIRRGRYVEFNLIHDRGTLFGLKTNGRTESILMSLPPTVRFEYDYQPKEGSQEWKLLEVCRKPKNWI